MGVSATASSVKAPRWLPWLLTLFPLLAAVSYGGNANASTAKGVFGALLNAALPYAIGGAFGMLFAVPTVLETAGEKRTYGVNNSVAQISQWIVAAIVGVSLRESKDIVPRLKSAAEYFAPVMGGDAAAQAVSLAILGYFSAIGFWVGYLLMRIEVGAMLAGGDWATNARFQRAVDAGVAAASEGSTLQGDTFIAPRVSAEAQRELLGKKLSELHTPDEKKAWAMAHFAAGDANSAREGFDAVLQQRPDDADAQRERATLLAVQGEYAQAVQAYRAMIKPGVNIPPDIIERLLFAALHSTPADQDEAVRIAEAWLKRHQGEVTPAVSAYLACAYGQRHGRLKQQDPEGKSTRAEQELARERALEHARRAASSALWRSILLNATSKDGADDDLASLAEEVKAALGPSGS